MKYIEDINVYNKTVIVRVDFNVPMHEGKVTDATRIEKSLPTIQYLIAKGAKIIIMSHYGRPKGKYKFAMSLKPIALEFTKILHHRVEFIENIFDDKVRLKISDMKIGDIIFLENLRFHKEEEENNENFAKLLASFADIYVNDAFSSSHREHASICKITNYLPSYAGILLSNEVKMLDKLLSSPRKPVAAIIGGSKISTKIDLLYSLIKNTDIILIGGGMANSFLKAQGKSIGQSLYEPDMILKAIDILIKAEASNCKIILPIDTVISIKLENNPIVKINDIDNIPSDYSIFDIGPKTVNLFYENIKNSKTIIWNGPLGAFEYRPFDNGTISLALRIISLNDCITIAGGGDVIASLTLSGVINNFSYFSTAGGAFLEWLEFKWNDKGELPGIKVLY